MAYQNRWTFQGFTTESSDTAVMGLNNGQPLDDIFDTFPTQQVISALQTVMLSEITQKLHDELEKAGITGVTVTKIQPTTQIITTKEANWFYGFPPMPTTIFHHVVNMSATVYFDSDQAAIQSPIAPIVIAALVIVIKYLIVVAAVALVIYFIAETFIKSFFTQTQTVETYDPTTGKWTKETITQPSLSGQIIGAVVAVACALGLGYLASQYFQGRGKKK